MGSMWSKLRWLGFVLVLAVGCKTPDPVVEKPPHVEEFNLPPVADNRFTKPMAFPDGTPRASKLTRSGASSAPLSDPSRFQGGRPGQMGQGMSQ